MTKEEFVTTLNEKIKKDATNKETSEYFMDFLKTNTNNGKLYKYRTFNKWSLDSLEKEYLYCATPAELNDPFDCNLGIDIQSAFASEEKTTGIFDKLTGMLKGEHNVKDASEIEVQMYNSLLKKEKICEVMLNNHVDLSPQDIQGILIDIVDLYAEFMCNSIVQNIDEIDKDILKQHAMENVIKILEKTELLWECGDVEEAILQGLGLKNKKDDIGLILDVCQIMSPELGPNIEQIRESMESIAKELTNSSQKFRVGSLSSDYRNCLLWSHYADSHKGFCIEYDFSVLTDGLESTFVLPVQYSRKRIKFPWEVVFANNQNAEELKHKAEQTYLLSLLTKSTDWKYEDEWRVILVNTVQGERVKKLPISRIYIGACCEPYNRRRLINIANRLGIEIMEMKIDRGEYRVYAEKYEYNDGI